MKCTKCGHVNVSNAKFCGNCGNTLAPVCTHCGASLVSGTSFCTNCGTPVSPRSSFAELERLSVLQQAAPAGLKEKIQQTTGQLEGQLKPVTILFTDIVGSTALAEKLDPEEWKEVVNGAHRCVSQAVYRYEGTIAQLLGDGVLAFFGAPLTHEDDAIRAVHAALDIQAAINSYASELKGYIDNFQMRIGVNSGTVVVGSVGSDLHMEYLAIGDAVNLAARLQSAAQPGGVLISEGTSRLVSAAFELEGQGEISVKGKAQPVSVYAVLKGKAAPESGRGFEELRSPLVGREEELTIFHTALKALSSGRGQVVVILGEAGIGKNRLVEKVRGGCTDLHWIEGRALSYGQTLSFWSINQLIYNDLGLSDGDPEVRVRTALKRRVKELFGERAADILPYLGHLLGISLEDTLAERVRQLDGETLRYQTLLAISQYFQQVSEEKPTVMVWDDLHWADPSSLAALEQLLAVTDRAPLMIVLLSRLEREHGSWQVKLKAETDYAHRTSQILLKPLSQSVQSQIVDHLLAAEEFPEAMRQLILEHAEGNPFYLEEIVRSLLEQGAIIREGNQLRTTLELKDIRIPDTLQGVLLARIDRLEEDVRHTLQLASVIGKSFLYSLLQAIAEAEQQLDGHLAQLQRVDLVREKTRLPELEYMFKHSLTQEAAYNSLLVERRREFHLKVGEALEGLFAERKQQFLGLLAHHFEQAGEQTKAIDYLIQAGDQARLSDEHTEALGCYQRAIKILTETGDLNRAAQTWLKMGLIHNLNFQFEAAHQANETAFELQRKVEQQTAAAAGVKQFPLRIFIRYLNITLDPGLVVWAHDATIIISLFSGLARLDDELNVVPEVARSWQVLDGGRRYLFHLRDDWLWTDGTPVTAQDFEWAWKRNLDPDTQSLTARFAYDIIGAADYNQGRNSDADSVGVRALDAHTLEVRLTEPVAYLPFLVALPGAFPLPRKAIETYGETWWQPEHIVCNGPSCLVEFDAQRGGVMRPNPNYPKSFSGNIERIEWHSTPDSQDMLSAYQEDLADLAYINIKENIPDSVPSEEIYSVQELGTYFLVINPSSPPFDDVRARKALALTIDRQRMFEEFEIPIARGGLVPPGMPGHSPEIGLPYDVKGGRELLAQAGFPGGKGFPVIKGLIPQGRFNVFDAMSGQWGAELGIEIGFQTRTPEEMTGPTEEILSCPISMHGWVADYPDPDNFLRRSIAIGLLQLMGWLDADFDKLVEEAARTPDRKNRMAMYRRADRLLIHDHALVIILSYSTGLYTYLVKPWMKNYNINLLAYTDFYNLLIEEH